MIQSFTGDRCIMHDAECTMDSIMNLDLELFEEGEVGRSRDRVHVTLSGDGHIYFSGRAVEALGRPEGVALLFDRRHKVIGVMPSALNTLHGPTLAGAQLRSYRIREKNISKVPKRMLSKRAFTEYFAYFILCFRVIERL